MNFKNFFITENLAFLAKDLGNLLTSLQEYQEELNSLQRIPKKRLNNLCNSSFQKIKSILSSGNIPKNNFNEIKLLQKISFVLYKIEKNEFDYKEYFPKIIKNLEHVIVKLGMPVNSIASVDTAPTKDLTSLSDTEKSTLQKTADDTEPSKAIDVSKTINPTEPNVQADQLYAQSLGGSSGPMSAF